MFSPRVAEYPADFIPDTDKKGPDLTSSVPLGHSLGHSLGHVGPPLGSLGHSVGPRPIVNGGTLVSHMGAPLSCYHYPLPLPRSDSEHHYDEPHLATPSATSSATASSSSSSCSASTSPSATSTRTVGSSRADSVNGGECHYYDRNRPGQHSGGL